VSYPEGWSCPECQRLARQLQEAWQSDQRDIRARLRETAEASGREPEVFLRGWVMSLARMPDDEFESLQWARYARVAEVRRQWQEHEKASGHSGPIDSWRGALIFDAVLRSGYFMLRGSRGGR
jgi:hypothetical protein